MAFFRKTSGGILCPSCGRLTNADAAVCLICGRRNPGMWGFADPLRRVFGRGSVTTAVVIACVALYVASLAWDPPAALRMRGPFDLLAPSDRALDALGMTGAWAWLRGRWWTLLTAVYLHGSLLHLLFNVLWIRQLGPAVEQLYGPARLVVIFTSAGALGFAASTLFGVSATVGASGAIFGLLGALVVFGRRRGGVFGGLVLRQYGQWALVLFILGFVMPRVDNLAHAGGFAGGYLAGLLLAFQERRAERGLDQLLAGGAVAATLGAFGLALWTAFAGG
ncbi:MAG: rhomboid family intramembrane serine protease [Candidatus Rokuibacteriota bacterium]